jgi:HK97 family phage major capsid protein
MKNAKQLKEERASLVEQMQTIVDAAQKENRSLSAEENQQWDALHTKTEEIRATAERLQTQEQLNAEMEAREESREQEKRNNPSKTEKEERTSAAFMNYLKRGFNEITPEERALVMEARAQSTGVSSEGGYTVPKQMASSIEDALKAFGGVRSVATVISTSGGGLLSYPTSNDTGNEGALIAENTQVSQQDITFGNLDFNAYTYSSKMILVPNQLLQDSAFDLGAYIAQKIAERIQRITNRHFTVGTGTAQPKGVVTASVNGAGAAVAALTFDNIQDLIHSVDPEYRLGSSFMFNDATLKVLKKLKDNDGRYLWQPAIGANDVDTLFGKQFTINQHMDSVGANAKSIVFGDMKKYLIRDVQGISVLRLSERFADYNQTAFLAFSRHDGNLLDAGTNPIKHLAHAAA